MHNIHVVVKRFYIYNIMYTYCLWLTDERTAAVVEKNVRKFRCRNEFIILS